MSQLQTRFWMCCAGYIIITTVVGCSKSNTDTEIETATSSIPETRPAANVPQPPPEVVAAAKAFRQQGQQTQNNAR